MSKDHGVVLRQSKKERVSSKNNMTKMSYQSTISQEQDRALDCAQRNPNVTLDKKLYKLVAGESIDIPIQAVHRLENKESMNLQIIEIQKGDYLEEDDIIRIEDDYSRS